MTSRGHKDCQVLPAQTTPECVFLRAFEMSQCLIRHDPEVAMTRFESLRIEALYNGLVICSEHRSPCCNRPLSRRLVRRVDIVKCLMKNDKKVDD